MGTTSFHAIAPDSGEPLEPEYRDATSAEIDRAVTLAANSQDEFYSLPSARIGTLLDRIAQEIEAVGDALVERAMQETALTLDRLKGERARTINQLRSFAELVRDGSWKNPTMDAALPDRQPARRPDLRRTMIPIGPVAVWAASNFPLAFSVAGGDTAAALAAGCPVVVKAHPGHPGVSELTGKAVAKAIASLRLPPGIFSVLHGVSPEVSLELVKHPRIAAGAFTGSLKAGRALFDAAARRPATIPFFAEMGSVNPVFLLLNALAERSDAIAEGVFQSVTLGVGQFCTCPGVVVAVESPALERFAEMFRTRFQSARPGAMLTASIACAYRDGIDRVASLPAVRAWMSRAGAPALFETSDEVFQAHDELRHELFGPACILVRCASDARVLEVADYLEGSLTATVHATPIDLKRNRQLLSQLARKAGRLIFNGYPTGVEVCASMQHGGPYPATTDPRFTSVGAAAIQRFARPICFQDCPPEFLPPELQALSK